MNQLFRLLLGVDGSYLFTPAGGGDTRITEAGDTLITESGDTRITEAA